MNFVQIVGYIETMPEVLENKAFHAHAIFKVAVTSNFLESDGRYRTDIFPVKLWKGASTNIYANMHVNDLIAIKGRMEYEDDTIIVIAEHMEFLRLR